jgi:putative FmdB family regulatory protein
MPIYEYTCQDCQQTFEIIRPMKDADAKLSCIHCRSDRVKRQLSLFNAASGGKAITTGGGGCSGCAGGSCSTCGTH